jgi:hypothetical protein
MIAAPAKIEARNVEDLVGEMAAAYAKDQSEPLAVDLSRVVAITRPAGAVLVNALVTELTDATIRLHEPSQSPIEKLTYSGLGFAFANRQGKTQFNRLTPEDLQFARWKLPWTPAQQSANVQTDAGNSATLPDQDDPSLMFKAHAAFVHPHATSRQKYRRDIPYRIQGWLQSILPHRAQSSAKGHDFIDELQTLIYELVDNVAEHAWPQGDPQPLSLVQVSVARGNSSDIRDRIWVVVLDTGPGIPTTAAPKVGEAQLPRAKLLEGLLSGRFLQSDHRARGFGLPRVANICSRWRDSQLTILSDDARIVMENEQITTSSTERRIRGTVIVARFSTPPTLRAATN